ncbi:phosphoribosyltransferase [Hydrogenimonas cancrithermarum]|uniref:Phosphoribosyltransferase n=1 Tax=Hydrogenimonas cancrithermarum TaxID=2993563 RepID=A0ABN6WS10_9BACT|nr:phosphoribosyltransferase family protein [Hydrogenimonas cancrithermarum]BDY11854.1 phosphoribosyltransferase [Hydrogenimonas cancrithermarum]
MVFRDRQDAGRHLARALLHYKAEHPLVLAIPRGGTEVGFEVAKALNADFDILIARKLPFPDNPESGFGALAEDGSLYLIPAYAKMLDPVLIESIIARQQEEIRRRIVRLRGGRSITPLAGRTVILVDDGIAMGSTMHAAIAFSKHQHAAKIVVAAPVGSPSIKEELEQIVDDVVILSTPPYFRAVADAYENWYDVSDEEVLEIMKRWERERA